MAGSYPDAPSRRMAWDADCVAGFWYSGGSFNEWNTATKQELNDEDAVNISVENKSLGYYTIIFPQLRDVYGVFMCIRTPADGGISTVSTSVDTSDGQNGTWDDHFTHPDYRTMIPFWRTLIQTGFTGGVASGVRGIRIQKDSLAGVADNEIQCYHVYGNIDAATSPDRVLWIDNDTGLEFDAPLDWGDVPRGTTLTHDVLIKNNSSTLTANNTVLSFEGLFGSAASWHNVKETGGAYGSTLTITSISAGASYPTGGDLITIRLTIADAATLGLYAARAKALVGSWT